MLMCFHFYCLTINPLLGVLPPVPGCWLRHADHLTHDARRPHRHRHQEAAPSQAAQDGDWPPQYQRWTTVVPARQPRGVAAAASAGGVRASAPSTGIPHYPGNCYPAYIEEWLRLLRLEEYGPQLRAQGYHTIQVTARQPRGVAPAAAAGGVRASAPSTGIPHYPGNCQPA
jgi:hypothetical protein